MRGVAFIKQLMLSFPGNHYSHALCLADVDNDQANELVIGNVSGALQVFKGSDAKAWRTAGNLGTITALACGPVLNNGKNVVLVCSMEGKCHLLDFSTLDQPQSRENRGEGDQRKPVQKGDTVCRPFHEQHLSFNISSVLVSKFISGQHLVVVGRTDRAFTVYQWQEQQQQQSKDESRSVEARGHLVQLYSHSMSGQISSLSSTGLINGGIRSLLLSQPGGIMVPVVIGGEIPGVREAAIEKTDSASREVSPVPDDNLPKQQQPQQQQKSQEHKHQQPESPQPPEQPQQSKEQQQQQQQHHHQQYRFEVLDPIGRLLRHSPNTSAEVVGGLYIDDESLRQRDVVAMAMLDGSLKLIVDNTPSWTLKVTRNFFAAGKLRLKSTGSDVVVACAWDGTTYFVDHLKNVVKHHFHEDVCAFTAGCYGNSEGRNMPCLVYTTFSRRIYIFCDVELEAMTTTSALEYLETEECRVDPDVQKYFGPLNDDERRKLISTVLYQRA